MKGLNFLVSLPIILTAGCAGVKFYSDEGMEKEVGLKGCYSKPYVLVARNGADKATSVSMVNLADLEHPVYIKLKSGLGSANLSLGFTNCVISSVGQATDTQIPELLSAATGGIGSLATARKDIFAATENQSSDVAKYEVQIGDLANKLEALLSSPQGVALRIPVGAPIRGDVAKLRTIQAVVKAPGASARVDVITKDLTAVSADIESFSTSLSEPSERTKQFKNSLSLIKSSLDKIIEDLTPKAEPQAEFELYEIIMKDGKTTLKPVTVQGGGK